MDPVIGEPNDVQGSPSPDVLQRDSLSDVCARSRDSEADPTGVVFDDDLSDEGARVPLPRSSSFSGASPAPSPTRGGSVSLQSPVDDIPLATIVVDAPHTAEPRHSPTASSSSSDGPFIFVPPAPQGLDLRWSVDPPETILQSILTAIDNGATAIDLSYIPQLPVAVLLGLASAAPPVEVLVLKGLRGVTDTVAATLISMLPQLRAISLAECPRITDGSAAAAAASTTLFSIDFESCPFVSAAGMAVLGESTSLVLARSPDGAIFEADALRALRAACHLPSPCAPQIRLAAAMQTHDDRASSESEGDPAGMLREADSEVVRTLVAGVRPRGGVVRRGERSCPWVACVYAITYAVFAAAWLGIAILFYIVGTTECSEVTVLQMNTQRAPLSPLIHPSLSPRFPSSSSSPFSSGASGGHVYYVAMPSVIANMASSVPSINSINPTRFVSLRPPNSPRYTVPFEYPSYSYRSGGSHRDALASQQYPPTRPNTNVDLRKIWAGVERFLLSLLGMERVSVRDMLVFLVCVEVFLCLGVAISSIVALGRRREGPRLRLFALFVSLSSAAIFALPLSCERSSGLTVGAMVLSGSEGLYGLFLLIVEVARGYWRWSRKRKIRRRLRRMNARDRVRFEHVAAE